MDRICVFPSNSHVEAVASSVSIYGDGASKEVIQVT